MGGRNEGPLEEFGEGMIVEAKSAGRATAGGANAGNRRTLSGTLAPRSRRGHYISRWRREARGIKTVRKEPRRPEAPSPGRDLLESSEPVPPD